MATTPTPLPTAEATPPVAPPPVVETPPTPPAAPPDPLDRLASELADIKQTLTQRPQAAPPAAPSAPAQPTFDPKQLEAQFWQNPLGMMAAAQQASQQQTMAQLAPTLEAQARQQIINQDPALWSKIEADVTAVMANVTNPADRINPEVWENAKRLAIGKNYATLSKSGAGQPAATSTTAAPSAPPPPAAPKIKLNDDQRDIIRRLDMTEAEYTEGVTSYADTTVLLGVTEKRRRS